jgi:hypothetical protein
MADPEQSRAQAASPGDDASTSHAAPPPSEGASPDSLQNTPSNIARLEDAIENCAARRKYLARTKSPSDGEDVRWYFCKVPLADRGAPSSLFPPPRVQNDCRRSLVVMINRLLRRLVVIIYASFADPMIT